ncbi:prepilin peptidase [Mycolicibacterium confluentis]|uniref:prepilin peptidase n=1 Tax=Mycolicibacterium confluentis TaxID=28047 RepID=UPI000D6ADC04|nr:A24 family peptidase [Mycolicibacterium confluentis]
MWATAIVVTAWLVALSVWDLRTHRLPNALTLPPAAVILVTAALLGHGGAALAGALTLAGAYLVVHLVSPTGLGAGDVKLALGVGALTGAFGTGAWALAAVGAPVLTVVGALAVRRTAVPHGPGMCAATALAVIAAG